MTTERIAAEEARDCPDCHGRGYIGGGSDPESGTEDPGQPCWCTGGGNFPSIWQVAKDLEAERDEYRARVEKAEARLLQHLKDCTEDEDLIRGLCGGDAGDSFGIPPLVDVVRRALQEAASKKEATNGPT